MRRMNRWSTIEQRKKRRLRAGRGTGKACSLTPISVVASSGRAWYSMSLLFRALPSLMQVPVSQSGMSQSRFWGSHLWRCLLRLFYCYKPLDLCCTHFSLAIVLSGSWYVVLYKRLDITFLRSIKCYLCEVILDFLSFSLSVSCRLASLSCSLESLSCSSLTSVSCSLVSLPCSPFALLPTFLLVAFLGLLRRRLSFLCRLSFQILPYSPCLFQDRMLLFIKHLLIGFPA